MRPSQKPWRQRIEFRKFSTYQIHTTAVSVMMISAGAAYLAAQQAATAWIWVCLGCFIVGNLLELMTP